MLRVSLHTATLASKSIAYGAGITDCKARVTCRFIVQALDAYGNANMAGDVVKVFLDGSTVRGVAPTPTHTTQLPKS